MSPMYEKKPLELASVGANNSLDVPSKSSTRFAEMEPNPAQSLMDDDRNTFDDASWKAQRKLKHQRDLQKRSGSSATPSGRFDHHHRVKGSMRASHAHGSSRDNNQQFRADGVPAHAVAVPHTHGRSIPGRRKEKVMVSSPMMLSKSVPSARSWPPDKDVADLMASDLSEENLDPNWSLDGSAPLATSAPETSFLSRSQGSKREARTMTLFESAVLFHESGRLLSHDDFQDLGSSPELGPQSSRRKAKRRVGRHKPEKKKMDAGDHLSQDDVVLELMHILLPDMDVTKELNMKFLGGSRRHHGDVFDFEDDADNNQVAASSKGSSASQKLLTVDVLKFQVSLKKLVFPKDESGELELPFVGSSATELAELFLTPQWVAASMLRVVKLDVLAQYDAFSVLLAVYRTLPSHRELILKSLVSACLAIYDHQAMEHLQPTSPTRKLVSMKGTIAMLNAILSVTECELAETPDVFGENPQVIDESLDSLCGRLTEAVKLLVRSSPGGSKAKSDENNQVEKYQEGSDSVEATTYAAIGEVIYRLAAFSPEHGQELLTWMLRKWPQRNVQLQLFYVRFITGILVQFMVRGVFLPDELVFKVFSRLRACIKSPHFLIAKEAASVCGNLPLMDMYLSNDQELREQVSSALHDNARGHWNDRIRQMSDEYFDLLLDFA